MQIALLSGGLGGAGSWQSAREALEKGEFGEGTNIPRGFVLLSCCHPGNPREEEREEEVFNSV